MTDIIIPTYNNENYTIECLKSLKKYTIDYRIIWVDNGSTRESRDKVVEELINNSHNWLTIWFEKNYGFIKAVNMGIVRSNSEYIVLLNNDTAVIPNWLERLKYPFTVDKDVVAAGPFTDTSSSWQGWQNVKNKLYTDMPVLDYMNDSQIAFSLYKHFKNTYRQMKMIAFFCTLFKKSIFEQIGLLDEDFNIGLADDDDICKKIANANKKVVFVPSTFCHHYHRTTFKQLYNDFELKEYQDKNIRLFNKKHGINLKNETILQ